MSNDSLYLVKTKRHKLGMVFLEVKQMDLIQIGKFIAELRKEHQLTQEQLGEKIGVTNKTISRWETGTYLPPADTLMAMSQLFGISVNEILSGRRLSEEEYKEVAEENLAKALKASSFSLQEKIAFYKSKWLKEHIAIMIFAGVCIVAVMLSGIFTERAWLITISVVMLFVAHGWRNNAMMTYVEKHAYDGTGLRYTGISP